MTDEDKIQTTLNQLKMSKDVKVKVSFVACFDQDFYLLQPKIGKEDRKYRTANVSPGHNDSLQHLNNNILMQEARSPNESTTSNIGAAAAAPKPPEPKPN